MKTEEPVYIDFTPIELWRKGAKNSPQLDKVRMPPRPPGAKIDIETFMKEGEVWVKAGVGGVSLYNGINPRLDGTWWRIPANSPIPNGLRITKDRTDKITKLTHYSIEPVFDMPASHFIHLLTNFARHAEKAPLTTDEHGKNKV
jgi:hypothetical protein